MTENCQKINVSAGIIMNILPSTDLGWKQIFLSVCETSAVFWNSFLFTFLPQNVHINIKGSLLRILISNYENFLYKPMVGFRRKK